MIGSDDGRVADIVRRLFAGDIRSLLRPRSVPTSAISTVNPDASAGSANDVLTIDSTGFATWQAGSSGVTLGSALPLMDGTADPGVAGDASREDHVHPTDTSRASAADLEAHLDDADDAHDASAIGNLEYLLAEKSDEGHAHDERYWTRSARLVEYDDLEYLLAEKSDEGHTHDERYHKLSTDLATQAEFDAHLNDASDAHDASAISYVGGTGISATDVEAAIDELANEKLDTATAASTYVELAGDTMTGALLIHYASALLEVRASSGNATVEIDATAGTYSYLNLKIGDVIYGQLYTTSSVLSLGDGGVAALTMYQSSNNVALGNGFGTLTSLASNPAATDDSDKVATTSWTQDAIDEHRNDTSDAHDASAISVVDAGGYFTSTDVEGALQELGTATGGAITVEDVGGLDYVLAEKSDEGHAHDERYSFTPPGVLSPYAGASAPRGYLLCDGSAVSRTNYAALYAVIGTTFGVGDGSTTFNVPDLRGRVPVALDNLGGSDAGRLAAANTLGGTGGAETHTLTAGEMAHIHSIDPPNTTSGTGSGGTVATTNTGASTRNVSTHTHDVNIAAFNSAAASSVTATAHNNMQPYMLMGYIIKT